MRSGKETILFEIGEHPTLPASMVIRMDAGRYGTSVRAEFPAPGGTASGAASRSHPLWLEERAELFGGPFMVTRRMPGAPPGTLWDVGGAWHSMGLALADALARIHAIRLLTESETSRPLVRAMLVESEARWRARMPMPSIAMGVAYCPDGRESTRP